MYVFSLVLIRKTLTFLGVFFDDIISIVMMSTDVIVGEELFTSYSLWNRTEDNIL